MEITLACIVVEPAPHFSEDPPHRNGCTKNVKEEVSMGINASVNHVD